MISKPPELGNDQPEDWIRKFLGYFEKVRFEYMRVYALWFPVKSDTTHGLHPCDTITPGESAYVSIVIPRETKEIKEVVVRLIPTTSGTIDWTANASYGGSGEDESINTTTDTENGVAVVDDQITEIYVTQLFSDVSADDQVGFQFTLDAAVTTTDVCVLGVYFKFR